MLQKLTTTHQDTLKINRDIYNQVKNLEFDIYLYESYSGKIVDEGTKWTMLVNKVDVTLMEKFI